MNSNQATIQKLEQMGLWGMMRALRDSMEAGSGADFTPDELISRLVDVEWDERQGRKLTRLLKGARFRYRAGLEDLDFGLHRNLDKNQFMRLADCHWIEDRQDLILTGPCGCGKSFMASVLGQQACIPYLRELAKLTKKRLFIIDDFGLEVLDTVSRLILLEILEDRHGRASSIFSS